MKEICLCFQIHQPYRLRRYRFFDIGNEHFYNDEYRNAEIFERIANECYLPANRMMLELLQQYPHFKVSYSISGLAIEQMQQYRPEILESFKTLAATGRVEFLSETYAHSMTALYDQRQWEREIEMHRDSIRTQFGVEPANILCNTELLYNDEIGELALDMGFDAVLTEGAKHILGWKSPNYVYDANTSKTLKLLFRNSSLSELITDHFTRYDSPEYPITADKLLNKIKWQDENFAVLYMSYEVLGTMIKREAGIFDFFRALPMLSEGQNLEFTLPSELIQSYPTVDRIAVNSPITLSGEEKNANNWIGNVLQQGVIDKLGEWGERVRATHDNSLLQEWIHLQSADHLYYMNTNNDGIGFNPYDSAYDAFNNYMNVLSDFIHRIETLVPRGVATEQLNSYEETIIKQGEEIIRLQQEIERLKNNPKSNKESK